MVGARPARVAITTLGCKVNYAEMAELAGTLAAAGCDVVNEDEAADFRILNSCTVTTHADATTRQRLRRLRRSDPGCHLIVTGCSVDANPDRYLRTGDGGARVAPPGIDAVFSNTEKDGIAAYVLAQTGAVVGDRITRPAQLRARAFIKVQDGCDHRCTYCIVWSARGASQSIPVKTIVAQAAAAIANGHVEIVLTGVDLGSYGRDIGTRLSGLLEILLATVADRARVRLSSINANDVGEDLIQLNGHPQLCPHWHMPLQSGSDTILRAMHRGYRSAQYMRVVGALRDREPSTEFTTDVMVAFPGETATDNDRTIGLIEEVGFLDCHVFRFSARPGTPAAALDGRISDATARHRSALVREAAHRTAMQAYARAVGEAHTVAWNHIDGAIARGVTSTYHEIAVPAEPLTTPERLTRVFADGSDGACLTGRPLSLTSGQDCRNG